VGVTGGIKSDFYFLIYFLTIGVALLLKPSVSVILIVALIAFYYPEVTRLDSGSSLVKLLSLVMVTPLSMFFAKEYLKVQEQEEKIRFCHIQRKNYSSELEKIQDDFKAWSAFQLRGPLSVVKHYASWMLEGKLGKLNEKQGEYLRRIYTSNESVIKMVDDFEKKTEEEIGEILREGAHELEEEKSEN
jgi:signal transduction histidine kinase